MAATEARNPRPGDHRDELTRALSSVFEEYRAVLLQVGYRMLGRHADAEDVVQETWLRWSAADRSDVRDPRGYLVRTATRLALDRLRRAARHREEYPGVWLPEPLPTDALAPPAGPDGETHATRRESVSYAVLVVLESLSPPERAVFVLREAFDFPYAEIAETLDSTPAAVRQLAVRARRHVAARSPRYDVDAARHGELTERFLDAATGGDLAALLALLAPDARLVPDGGGRAKAPLRTITTAQKVGRFLAAIGPQAAELAVTVRELNGLPAVVAVRPDGDLHGVFVLEQDARGRIGTVYLLADPEKLAPLAERLRPFRGRHSPAAPHRS
ncbi:RNA polymerase sigma factor SigJ [Streptomyces xiaopingdaonensis]|uniref:RNA polymerase sigma factor SigJ n=1 Tax=Streptomyces xiaopingdaonensis TaxID=1565415 RepID=UPI0002E80AA3|nr:RNA polymerase sigma factor SigJ [Streptomyces xiaopingdaonensis]